jgi:hypothetical protein
VSHARESLSAPVAPPAYDDRAGQRMDWRFTTAPGSPSSFHGAFIFFPKFIPTLCAQEDHVMNTENTDKFNWKALGVDRRVKMLAGGALAYEDNTCRR